MSNSTIIGSSGIDGNPLTKYDLEWNLGVYLGLVKNK